MFDIYIYIVHVLIFFIFVDYKDQIILYKRYDKVLFIDFFFQIWASVQFTSAVACAAAERF